MHRKYMLNCFIKKTTPGWPDHCVEPGSVRREKDVWSPYSALCDRKTAVTLKSPSGDQWSTNLPFQDLQCGRAKETLRWLTKRNQGINGCSAFRWLHPDCRDRDSPWAKLTSAQSINKLSQGAIKLSLTLVVPTSRVTHLEFHQRFCTIQEHRWLLSGSSQHLRQTPTFAKVKGEEK